jgi:hypothetical protein
MDGSFEEIYRGYTWLSENVLRIGENAVAQQTCEIIVANESGSTVSYLLLETMYSKAIIFDLAQDATVQFKFPFAERLSGQGEMAVTGKRFGAGVENSTRSTLPSTIFLISTTLSAISHDSILMQQPGFSFDAPLPRQPSLLRCSYCTPSNSTS